MTELGKKNAVANHESHLPFSPQLRNHNKSVIETSNNQDW